MFLEVPAGTFRHGDDKVEMQIPYRYWIAKYPVTNDQYPWADISDEAKAIARGSISPACMYPQGESPVGAWDMAGNVGEWTLTRSGDRISTRVVRDGFSRGGHLPFHIEKNLGLHRP
jgi:formylglycine-generating enzyme required for sulfatase activity